MQITEVRFKLNRNPNDRLLAFCSVVFDDMLAVHGLKIIRGPQGPFVAMPARKTTSPCDRCRERNAVDMRFCGACGSALPPQKAQYNDIAHPINAPARSLIEKEILEAYQRELKSASPPTAGGAPREALEKLPEESEIRNESAVSGWPFPRDKQSSPSDSEKGNAECA